jgi:hypothetical protein
LFSELPSFSALRARPPALPISSGKSRTPSEGTEANNPAHLDWLTTSNSAFDAQCVLGELANHPPPDPERRSPAAGIHGAPENGQLSGTTKTTTTAAGEFPQAGNADAPQQITLRQQADAVERIAINQRGYINVLRSLVKNRRRPQRDLTMALSWFPALEAAVATMRRLADQQQPSSSPGPSYEIGGRHFHAHHEIPRKAE